MSKTTENLKAAFAGESQANRRYLAFAKKADEDGMPGLAKLFRAAADGETVHAHAHLKVLGEVKTSAENLKTAIAGENYEISPMYPEFYAAAQEENNKAAETSFSRALAVEKIHSKKYQEALERIENNEDVLDAEYFVCQVCGNLETGSAPEICPICGSPKDKFLRIE